MLGDAERLLSKEEMWLNTARAHGQSVAIKQASLYLLSEKNNVREVVYRRDEKRTRQLNQDNYRDVAE